MASKRRQSRAGAAADEPSKKAGRTEHPLMSLLKTFGVGNQQMMFSELLDHITKDAVDDLFEADPSETALKIGAQLIVQIFFWMKENIESHMLGTSEDTSTRAATRAEMETLEREDEAVPLTADVAVELRRILQHVYAIFEILDQNEDFEEPAAEVRPMVRRLNNNLKDAGVSLNASISDTKAAKDYYAQAFTLFIPYLNEDDNMHFFKMVNGHEEDGTPNVVAITTADNDAYWANKKPTPEPPKPSAFSLACTRALHSFPLPTRTPVFHARSFSLVSARDAHRHRCAACAPAEHGQQAGRSGFGAHPRQAAR